MNKRRQGAMMRCGLSRADAGGAAATSICNMPPLHAADKLDKESFSVWQVLGQRLFLKVGNKVQSAFDIIDDTWFALWPPGHDTVHKLRAKAGKTGNQVSGAPCE